MVSIAVSNLGKTSLMFAQPGWSQSRQLYYGDVILNQSLLPDIQKLLPAALRAAQAAGI